MEPYGLLSLFAAAFSAFCGIGVLLVRVSDKELRVFWNAWPLRYRWGRRLFAAAFFVMSGLALAEFFGWLRLD